MLRSIGSVTLLALFMVGCGGGSSGGASSEQPPPPTYSIGGTVTGLTGSGLVLQTNAGDLVAVSGAAFTFTNQLGSGAAYSVTVKTLPSAPVQNCTVLNGSGTVGTANITTVAVACSAVTGYTVGGAVTGLTGSGLMLQTNAGDLLAVSKAGAFTFANQLGSGAIYTVAVIRQPSTPAQNCTVTNGFGMVGTANVTNVTIACSNAVDYTVGGTVSGLVGTGLTLGICTVVSYGGPHSTRCHDQKQVGANGAFTLGSVYPAGYSGLDYVAIFQQPSSPTQICVISNANVSIQIVNDTSVTVSCAEYSYVTNATDNTLSSYSVDATTGALAIIGTPTATGASPYAIVGTSDKRFVYVTNQDSNDVSAFAVDPATGSLTPVPGSPFPAGTDPQAMALYESSYLYVANAGSNNVSGYIIDPNTGALAELFTTAAGMNPTSIAVHHYGFIYEANHGGSNDISEFYPYGAPVPVSRFPAGGNPLSLAFGAADQFLYAANPDAKNPSISGFRIDRALSPLSGSPFPLPVSHYIATDQTGAYLYVTSGASIVGYAIDYDTGALTALPGFPVAAGANPYSITIDPTNQFLYVANDGTANIAGFRLNASTGALTPMAGSPFPAGHHPQFIATF